MMRLGVKVRKWESAKVGEALVLVSVFAFLISPTAFAANEACDSAGLPVMCREIGIQDAVSVALANHPSVAARRAMAAAAAARTRMARSSNRLQLSTSTFATAGNMPMILAAPEGVMPQSIKIVPDDRGVIQSFMAMYPLYTGGRLSGRIHGAEALQSAASAEARMAELDAALAAKIAFHNVLLAGAFVEAYQTRVDESKERLRIAEIAFNEGKIAKYDLLRNRTDLSEAEQMLVESGKDRQMAMIDLNDALGVSQSSEITLQQAQTANGVERDPDKARELALSRRPEMTAARERIRLAQASVDVAKSAFRPQVYATAMQDLGTTRHDGSDAGYIVGITAALPIFDGGERRSAVAESRAMLEQAQAEQKQAALMVSRDVAAAIAELDAALKTEELAKAAVSQAEEDYRVVKMRYEAGKSINVEVLDALAAYIRAKTALAQAVTNSAIAVERLKRAEGCM